jgi:hypothetical protein
MKSAATTTMGGEPDLITHLADLLVPFTEHASIPTRDVDDALRKRIIVSLGFTQPDRLHALLYPNQHIDWANLRVYLREARYTVADWVRLIALFHFVHEAPTRPTVAELLTAAAIGSRMSTVGYELTPIEALQLCFARAGYMPPWDTLCKALLLCNLVDVDVQGALGMLLPSMPAVSEGVVRHLPMFCKHTPDEYTRTFAQLLAPTNHRIASHFLLASLKARDDAKALSAVSTLDMLRSARPSLTQLLVASRAKKANPTATTAAGAEQVLRRFCNAARIPANVTHRFKQACYYVAALPAPFFAHQPRELLARRFCVSACLEELPHIELIRSFIYESQHTGPVTCVALQRFHALCPTRAQAHWTMVLRLYLAAYSRFFKELWTHMLNLPALSPETETAVQAFTRANPMALADLLSHLTSSA